MKTRAKLRLLPLQLLSGRIEPRKRNRAAQMRWRGKKEIQRWPWYIWGETERERRGVRGFRQHGKGPPVQPVTGKEGRPGGGGEVDTYVPILPYDRYPIPKCSNSFLFFFFFFFSCGCDSVNIPSPLSPPPHHKTEQDPITEHPIRPDRHPSTTVIDQPTSVF